MIWNVYSVAKGSGNLINFSSEEPPSDEESKIIIYVSGRGIGEEGGGADGWGETKIRNEEVCS